jgi:hypothetical protein
LRLHAQSPVGATAFEEFLLRYIKNVFQPLLKPFTSSPASMVSPPKRTMSAW